VRKSVKESVRRSARGNVSGRRRSSGRERGKRSESGRGKRSESERGRSHGVARAANMTTKRWLVHRPLQDATRTRTRSGIATGLARRTRT
jgi:hypothetical protein